MHNPRIGRWRNLDKLSGLLLFAQRIEESLFNYSIDSYKAPALNTHTRCQELITTTRDVVAHRITPKALQPVVEELAHSISTDVAAKDLLGSHAALAGAVTWWRTDDPLELRTKGEFVRGFLRRRAYERAILARLRPLVEVARDKSTLLHLTGDLVVEWRRMGFSNDFIYYRARGHFFSIGRGEIAGMEEFDAFVDCFSGKAREFEVVLRGAASWRALVASMPDDLALIEDPPKAARAGLPKEAGFFARPHGGVYITVRGISALDSRAATEIAATRIRAVGSVATLHLHREPMHVDGEAVVYSDGPPVVLKAALPPMQREEDCGAAELQERFVRTVEALGPHTHLNEESWSRIAASLNLHAAAVASSDPSVHITGLWAALEALLPADPDDSKIGSMVRVLVPALCRYYPLKLFGDLHRSLERCCPAPYAKALASVAAAEHPGIRCAYIVAVPDAEPLRDSLYPHLQHNPLLRYRVFALMCAFKSGKAAAESMRAHEQRVAWQIRRIYRARNLLLHSGRSLPYRDALIENLHAYFHELLRSIERLCAGAMSPADLDSALLRISLDHTAHIAALESIGRAKTTVESLPTTLMGPMRQIS